MFKKQNRAKIKAFLVLMLEGLSRALWRSISWIFLFLGLWLFDLPQILSPWGGMVIWLIFVIGLWRILRQDFQSFQTPSRSEIERRIESDSALAHRPFMQSHDALFNDEKGKTRTLWQNHKARMHKSLAHIKLKAPRAILAQRDPNALRLAAILFLIAAFLTAGFEAGERLKQGLIPFPALSFLTLSQKNEAPFTLWITPPDYTRQEQILIETTPAKERAALNIPEGSRLKLSLRSSLMTPRFFIDETPYELTKREGGNYSLDLEMPEGSSFKIRKGLKTYGPWTYHIVPDLPPEIILTDTPTALPNARLRIPLSLKDDYSVQDLHLSMTRSGTGIASSASLGHPYSETRTVLSPAATMIDFEPLYDVSAHPWAGLPVTLDLSVTDERGQKAVLPPITLILPERDFHHPIAKEIIALRKELIQAPLKNYKTLSFALERFLYRPDEFKGDFITFLALRVASSRLYRAPISRKTARSVVHLLWDIALRIEDGNLSLAARALKQASQELNEALQDPEASSAKHDFLMDKLRQAMAEYFREVQRQMMQGHLNPMISPDMMAQMMNPEALGEFLNQMALKMKAGEVREAQDMLAQLQRMMDMMSSGLTSQIPADIKMMETTITGLQDLIEKQQTLLDLTQGEIRNFNAQQKIKRHYGAILSKDPEIMDMLGLSDMPPPPQATGETPAQASINTQKHQKMQTSLRDGLKALVLEASALLKSLPKSLDLADTEMKNAALRLGKNQPARSIPHQEQALEYMKEGQSNLSEQMQARLQKMGGQMIGMGSGSGMRFDPLGRPYQGKDGPNNTQDSDVNVPDKAQKKTAQDILKTLRKRAGEYNRPPLEREYYKRLLRQF